MRKKMKCILLTLQAHARPCRYSAETSFPGLNAQNIHLSSFYLNWFPSLPLISVPLAGHACSLSVLLSHCRSISSCDWQMGLHSTGMFLLLSFRLFASILCLISQLKRSLRPGSEALFTWVHFRFKTHNCCYGYACHLHYSGVFNSRKTETPKTPF